MIATNVEKLVKTSKKVFRSQNKPCYDYHWPTTTHHTNLNAILTRFTLLYNPYNRKLFTPFQQLDHCNVHQGLCKLNHMIFVWNPPAKIDCPQLNQIDNTTMILHLSPAHKVYRLEIPKLAISIHHWFTCSARSECLKSDAICGFSEFVIIPQNCQLRKHKSFTLARRKLHASKTTYAVFLQDLEDNLEDSFKRLEASINFLRCNIQNLLSLTLAMQSKLHPSQLLSALLGTQRAAVIRGDTLSELSCSPLKVQLKRSLIHGNFFATRPLFEPVETDHLSKSIPRVLQLNEDLYLTANVLFLENHRPNRVFRFEIANSFYLFINYTLAGTAQDIIKLSPTLFPINETLTSRDYIAEAATIDYEPIEDRNLNAILATLATANLCNDRIRTFLDSQTNISSTSSSDFQSSNIAHYLHNSFLMLLSSISSPFFNALISLLTVLSLTFSLILTIFTLIHIYKKLKPSVTPFLIAKWQILRKRLSGKKSANVAVEQDIESDQENELIEQHTL